VAVGKGAHLETLTFHHVSEGISHGLVIINDEDDVLGKVRRRLSFHQISFAVRRTMWLSKSRKFGSQFDL
jgi:hypothetical protein